jgi:hypothetical protein
MPATLDSGPTKPAPTPIGSLTAVQGLLSVAATSSTGNATGVWGFVGAIENKPQQTTPSPANCGVLGQGPGDAVVGIGGGTGVHGTSTNGVGVSGASTNGWGVSGTSTGGPGVVGSSQSNYGIYGSSKSGIGVRGDTADGIAGVVGMSTGKGLAGRFDGTVELNGNLTISGNITTVNTITVTNDVVLTGGQDCAEQFDVLDAESPEPGTILVIGDDGRLSECQGPYDKRVAGVVSGAGEYRPAIVLGRRESSQARASVALVGKVFCKVDADFAPIAVGDLLTTSARPGFGMKATDSARAFGAVIGKALGPLRAGQGMIPILVALQ